jgi:elongation factor 1-beta
MPVEFKNALDTEAGLKELDAHLASRSYIEGFKPSAADSSVFQSVLPNADEDAYPHVARWQSHIGSFCRGARKSWGGQKANVKASSGKSASKPKKSTKDDVFGDDDDEKEAPAKAPKKKAAAKSDNPFGDDDDEPAADAPESDDEAQKVIDEIARKKNEKDAAAGKKVVIAKSTVIFDVKPFGSETDMSKLEANVRSIEMKGLRWAGSELVEIAYGVKKLRIISVIVDDDVSVDDLQDKIQGFEEEVQSVDIYAFNKV